MLVASSLLMLPALLMVLASTVKVLVLICPVLSNVLALMAKAPSVAMVAVCVSALTLLLVLLKLPVNVIRLCAVSSVANTLP